MTEFQLNTFTRVKSLQEQIAEKTDPSTFVLNKEVIALMNELAEARELCAHNWVDGICTVCGAIEEEM